MNDAKGRAIRRRVREARAASNVEKWGTVDERAALCVDTLRTYGPMTASELAERTGLSSAAVGGALSKAKQLRLGVGRSGGKWRVQS